VNIQSKIKLQKGASLLEVLIALFILGVGLLGVLAMQAESLKLNQQSYGSTQALFLANDAVERMRTNIMVLDRAGLSAPRITPTIPSLF
jgi:type IV pilus assembly protein PilV